MCVTAAIAVFLYQVIYRSKTFLDYNTSVDLQVLYEDEIPFPAVTICNQNTFRYNMYRRMVTDKLKMKHNILINIIPISILRTLQSLHLYYFYLVGDLVSFAQITRV